LTTPKFKLTTNGDIIIYTAFDNTDNNNQNNYYSMESLVTFQQQRIEALQEHIKMLEDECKALYSQINDCDCNLTVMD
jgi:septal ring factor EnvC (AmiA/AmiB activator)